MTKRIAATPAPGPLEDYTRHFDPLFGRLNQRESFRQYLTGLLIPAERNKTLTALANTEPLVGAQHAQSQRLQWFLSESDWDPVAVSRRRLEILLQDPCTAPDTQGVLVIDEHGDRKWGTKTAHVGRQYLANLGKVDNGVVSVSSLWADERVYYPLHVEPYTPAAHFIHGKHDPAFRTKLQIAEVLVERALVAGIPFRAVVADSFYGEQATFRKALQVAQLGYVLARKPSHAWWHPVGTPGSLVEVAEQAGWAGSECPGAWVPVERHFRDSHAETWWGLEIVAGPYGPQQTQRAIIATSDPAELPGHTTWYLVTNLPVPGTQGVTTSEPEPANLAEVVRLYGLRMWVEQSYKQTKHALGWSQYQVRSDQAIRRHWELVCCAFCFCWWAYGRVPDGAPVLSTNPPPGTAGEAKKKATAGLLATGATSGACLAGTGNHALALLASVVRSAPSRSTATIA